MRALLMSSADSVRARFDRPVVDNAETSGSTALPESVATCSLSRSMMTFCEATVD